MINSRRKIVLYLAKPASPKSGDRDQIIAKISKLESDAIEKLEEPDA